jgi:hypothetical protein
LLRLQSETDLFRCALRSYVGWRNIAVTLIMPSMSEMAFHEKAGRSQGNSGFMLFAKLFLLARSPLSPCFHPHSRGANRFAGCMLGVLNSAGAAICLAPCGSTFESGTRARPLTQSPELGFGFLSFLFLERF